jgi:hypothetical protein
MEQTPAWEDDSSSCGQQITHFLWKLKAITPFTRLRHWAVSWVRRIKSTCSYPISLWPILMLPVHLRLGLSSYLLASTFATKIIYAFVISHACYMPHLSNHPWRPTVIIFGDDYRLWKVLVWGPICAFFSIMHCTVLCVSHGFRIVLIKWPFWLKWQQCNHV